MSGLNSRTLPNSFMPPIAQYRSSIAERDENPSADYAVSQRGFGDAGGSMGAPAVTDAANTDADRQQPEQAGDDTRRRDNDHQVGRRQWSAAVVVVAAASQLSRRGLLTVHCRRLHDRRRVDIPLGELGTERRRVGPTRCFVALLHCSQKQQEQMMLGTANVALRPTAGCCHLANLMA